ncbi:MAG: preprotein translocase subunit SecE [Clostridia bacterium]|nr:preprotein translocase subunit SecE [Clostridia bacterium]
MPKSKKKVNSKSVKKDIKEVKDEVKVETKEENKEVSTKKSANTKPKAKNQKKPTKKAAKKDKNNRWFKEFKAELKKIIWPSRSELIENSVVVISMVILVAAIIFVLDLAFKSLNSAEVEGAKKLKNTITVSSEENTTEDQNTEESSEQTDEGTEIETSNSLVNEVEAVWTEDTTSAEEDSNK